MFGKHDASCPENHDCYYPACRSKRNPLLHTCTQTSAHQLLDDSGVEYVDRAIGTQMPNSIVLGAGSRRNDGKRTRHSGLVRELQMPLPTVLQFVFGPLNCVAGYSPCGVRIFFVAHRYLAIWDAHYSADITKVTEKGGIWRRGLKFVVTGSQEQREGAKPDPEHPGSDAQEDSRVRYPPVELSQRKGENCEERIPDRFRLWWFISG